LPSRIIFIMLLSKTSSDTKGKWAAEAYDWKDRQNSFG
jgi:hypothetical protein